MSLYDLQQLAGSVFPLLAPVAGAIYTWFATRQAAARKELDEINERLEAIDLQLAAAGHNTTAIGSLATNVAEHEKRLMNMEAEFKHLPAREDVSELKLAISELSGTVGRLEEQLKGSVGRLDEQVSSVGRTVHRIDDYLRESGRAS